MEIKLIIDDGNITLNIAIYIIIVYFAIKIIAELITIAVGITRQIHDKKPKIKNERPYNI